MKTKRTNSRPFTLTRLAGVSVVALMTAGIAQFGVAAEVSEKASSDDKVLVTGTRLKKVDIENLTPIISISREDIDKQGFGTVKDVIDNLPQNTGGTIDNAFTFGFTPGASSVNLRGIGFGHTLILVDGRRLPIYPIGIGGTDNFVDLSSIPVAFVERIDVLTDGASAVYGSDAVSGVINVITRKDLEGVITNYRYSAANSYSTQRFNLLTGARNGDTQIDLVMDYWDQAELAAADRDFASSDLANPRGRYSFGGSSFIGLTSGNVYQDPNCGTPNDAIGGLGQPDVSAAVYSDNDVWCGYDRSVRRQLIAPQNRLSLMSRLSYEISDDVSLFGRVGYSQSTTKVRMEPNFYGGALLTGFGTSVPNNGGLVPAGASNNPTTGSALEEDGYFVRRLVEFGDRKQAIDNNSINLLLGLNGSFGEGQYDWELGLSYNKTDLHATANNILLSAFNAEVESGLNLFEPIPQWAVDIFSFSADRESESINKIIDFSIAGDTNWELSGGPVKFALAFEQVDESYRDTPDPLVKNGDAFDGVSGGEGERKHLGMGLEFSLPLTSMFEMDIATRWDDYRDESDVGSALSPRVSMAYQWTDNLMTRLSWGKSFRAPDVQRLFGDVTFGFLDIQDPEFATDDNGQPCSDPFSDANCHPALIQSVNFAVLSNLDLEEEKGENWNLGLVWDLTDDLNVSADYYRIEVENIVRELNAQEAVNLCFQFDVACELVVRDVNGTLNGSDALVITYPLNFEKNRSAGVDITADYRWQNAAGDWKLSLMATWVNYFETLVSSDSKVLDEIDIGAKPEWRYQIMLDWQRGPWGALLKYSYVDQISGAFCFICRNDQFVSSWSKWDANVFYQLSDYARIRLGANNLLDEEPPEDPTNVNWPWFRNAAGYYNAIGREWYLQVDVNF